MSDDNYVAWCRYTDTSIVTCDSDADNAFKVYRRADDPDTIRLFNQMSDCLDDIRKILEDRSYASRLNQFEAIRRRINFSLPDTPSQLDSRVEYDALAAENAKLRAACEAAHELSDAELIAWCKEYAVEKRKEAECADYDHWRNSYIREADTFDAIAARLAQPTDA